MDFEYSAAKIRKVKRIQFGVLCPDTIKEMSVVEVTSPYIFADGLPAPNGIMDAKMGTVSRKYACQTCHGTRETCPGHFGHMTLARPLYHVGFLTITLRILRCVCYYCSRLLCDKEMNKDGSNQSRVELFKEAMKTTNKRERLIKIWALCDKMKQCGSDTSGGMSIDDENSKSNCGCGKIQPRYKKGTGVKIEIEFPKTKDCGPYVEDNKSYLSAQRVHEIFQRISNEDCQILGFNPQFCHPHWLLIQVLPVSPPAVRPFVMMDGMRASQDDITHKLYDILRTNNALKKHELNGVPEHILEEFIDLLQFHVTTMIDNEISGQPQSKQKSGKPLKSLRQRLVGKTGRIRGNLMGKRCDFSARTVITGDPLLSIDEVGIPRSMAYNLTYPERVGPYNIRKLQKLVNNGPKTHPGAKTLTRENGDKVDLRFFKGTQSDLHLHYGYIVERHIQDGDIVLFNRQPSLHKMSMMAHYVKIMPYSTFRINLSVTTPYNADFDGDEMNLHVPQSDMAKCELNNLALVSKQIVSPQDNKPIMGIVQDSLLSAMKLSKRDCFFTREEVFNLLTWLDESWDFKYDVIPIPCIIKPKELWSGKQLLSIILPKKLNLIRTANGRPDNELSNIISASDTIVRIENGELLSGIIDKRTIGTTAGGIIHVIFNQFGPNVTKTFFNEISKLTNAFFLIHSSSIGIGDIITDDNTNETIDKIIDKARREVHRTIEYQKCGKLNGKAGQTMRETFENEINDILNKAMNDAGKAVKHSLHKSNNIKQMVDAGSKGNAINISQIIACVGQQNVQGKRIANGFNGRTLPHYLKHDNGPEARGFVTNSYVKGLTSAEVFFHAMGGREGIIDTAIKTASTGYIQRRLVKAMEDVTVAYDGTVRNSTGNVIQFLYGEDGLDGIKIERQRMPHIMLSDNEFENVYKFDLLNDYNNSNSNNEHKMDRYLSLDVKFNIRHNYESMIILAGEFNQLKQDRDEFRKLVFPMLGNESSLYLPVNIERLIWNIQKEFGINYNDNDIVSDLNPIEVIIKVNELIDSIKVSHNIMTGESHENDAMLFKMFIRATLASKRVCKEYKLTLNGFNSLVGEIKSRFGKAIVDAGESVGIIAAQSIGAPATQMTLNTFHFAGVSAKNVTLGVPRLQELINVANNIKTPSLTVYLTPNVACDQDASQTVLNTLEHCCLRDIVTKAEIFYDGDARNSVILSDREFLEDIFDLMDDETANVLNNACPWMLRFAIDRNKKEVKNISNEAIGDKIHECFGNDVRCLYNNDNADEIVLQIRLLSPFVTPNDNNDNDDENDDDATYGFLCKLQHHLLDNVTLKGIPGIKKVFMRKENIGEWDISTGEWNNKARKDWVLDTDGIGLLQAMMMDGVDATKTVSNHIVEMLEVLGIEAARQALLNEIRNVISFDGSYVNYRHLSLLVDTMTCGGHLMSITRHGINRRETGALMRCSFEETVEILSEAAYFSNHDDLLDCSSNIMLGQLAPHGTGACDLLLDEDMLNKVTLIDISNEDDCYNHLWYQDSSEPWYPLSPIYNDVTSPNYFYSPSPNDYNNKFGCSRYKYEYKYGYASPTAFSPLAHNSGSYYNMNDWGSPLFSPIVGDGSSTPLPISPSYNNNGEYEKQYDSPNYMDCQSNYKSDYSPNSPIFSDVSMTSPNYSPTSPSYSPTSPTYSPTSPTYSPTSPHYSPTSPTYSPTSPYYTSHAYAAPTSPKYSPTSPVYSPTSPTYSPTSPSYRASSDELYSPTSLVYSPTSPTYSPTSPVYSPTSPTYSPTSPDGSPTSPNQDHGVAGEYNEYSPVSPAYSPTSPSYSPISPAYVPHAIYSDNNDDGVNGRIVSRISASSPSSVTSSPGSPNTSPVSPHMSPQYTVSWTDGVTDDSSETSGIESDVSFDHSMEYDNAVASSDDDNNNNNDNDDGIVYDNSDSDDAMSHDSIAIVNIQDSQSDADDEMIDVNNNNNNQ